MSDDVLTSLDQAFALSCGKRLRPGQDDDIDDAGSDAAASQDSVADTLLTRWPWTEAFVAVQFLWGALLFIPGAQKYRPLVRGLPYVSSLGLLAISLAARGKGRYPWNTALALGSIALLAVNLLHPNTPAYAGIAQCVFQLSIVAPAFWATKSVGSGRQLERLLVLALVFNTASAGLGLLQVYYPDQLMPPQFSALGLQMNDAYVDSQTYVGQGGRVIVRPPGLTDMPGGAAVAGGLAAVLGLALSLRQRKGWRLLACFGAAAVGIAVIYLTQVRSVLVMVIGAIAVLSLVAFRHRRVGAAAWIAAAGGALVIVAYMFASSVGGAAVEERFLSLREDGPLETFKSNRGHFLAYTVGELLDQFPLGAGVGRWGMMSAYFGEPTDIKAQPIYVEIQLTGWLLDGGVPMWLFYGGGVLLSILYAYRHAARQSDVGYAALAVLTLQILIAGMGMAGPVFNTQLGAIFWMFGSALHGASVSSAPSADADDEEAVVESV